ncbi:MAG: hypothetical protein K8F52_00505 [Candidatus Scalindua rubra]|uniref:Lipoprotein n=1 Tax=Candidatus Scalindua brodae TaxID=237368 RepID=A0A0B0EKF8_9BACT|nr:MAG: hypothetical protein SCABRO_03031 [Candidatus Scalindua brodae]MBZ0107120.1 hypothetical protein [Candidatus Scalindua rubra]TWU38112.1 hypothetical protein S225a_01590 [Candidatus Brocadiaceae bacterium S225]
MMATQRLLYKSFFAILLLFVVYGCQTTNNTVTSEPSVAEPTSGKTQSDAEHVVSRSSTVEKEASVTSAVITDDTSTKAMKETAQIKKFETNFLSKLSGHGGATPSGKKKAVKPVDTGDRPYIEMEKQLYGKWINKLETESYDFLDDGTVSIVVSGQRGMTRTLHGNYKIVEADRIKLDFRGDSMASQMPPRYFKLSISENAFSLTDEPKKKGEPDGPTTKYNRVE